VELNPYLSVVEPVAYPLYHITHSSTRDIAYVYNSLCKIYLCLEKHEGNGFLSWLCLKNKWNLFF
jgi:hypothetical protein